VLGQNREKSFDSSGTEKNIKFQNLQPKCLFFIKLTKTAKLKTFLKKTSGVHTCLTVESYAPSGFVLSSFSDNLL
jgi:hypothetical protein